MYAGVGRVWEREEWFEHCMKLHRLGRGVLEFSLLLSSCVFGEEEYSKEYMYMSVVRDVWVLGGVGGVIICGGGVWWKVRGRA